jgi:hypothetical protein
MEIHKHPHHVTQKKKWGEYLLEFLMIFLAVFLGFVAENIRNISVRITKKDLRSLYAELKMICSRCRQITARLEKKKTWIPEQLL